MLILNTTVWKATKSNNFVSLLDGPLLLRLYPEKFRNAASNGPVFQFGRMTSVLMVLTCTRNYKLEYQQTLTIATEVSLVVFTSSTQTAHNYITFDDCHLLPDPFQGTFQ